MVPARRGLQLLAEVEASGLTGRGGAGFPVGAKWRAVARAGLRRPVVVANGAEGEPASMKDAVLLTRAPHLVLDGAAAAASAVGAERVVVYVHHRHAGTLNGAIEERRRAGIDAVAMEVVVAPEAFLAGQESAAVHAVDGRPAVPSFVAIRPVRERGVGQRPTLVQNVETLAHVALVARYGAAWFRGVGTGSGTMLVTVHGPWPEPRVLEVPVGTPLRDVVGLGAFPPETWQGALLGGYGGTWVPMTTLSRLPLFEPAARRAGATVGAGIVALLPAGACPAAEVARLAAYLRGQGAGQCGPCVHGLGELSDGLCELAFGRSGTAAPASQGTSRSIPAAAPGGGGLQPLLDLCELVEGRGACKHPDGVARMVRSACGVFGDHLRAHLVHGPCAAAGRAGVLPVPEQPRWDAA